MKKILQSLMTLAMLLGITQFGQAQETTYSVTVDWGIPGAVQLKTAGKIIEGIPADATSYTVTSTDQWFSVVVMPNYGYAGLTRQPRLKKRAPQSAVSTNSAVKP